MIAVDAKALAALPFYGTATLKLSVAEIEAIGQRFRVWVAKQCAVDPNTVRCAGWREAGKTVEWMTGVGDCPPCRGTGQIEVPGTGIAPERRKGWAVRHVECPWCEGGGNLYDGLIVVTDIDGNVLETEEGEL